MGPEESVFDEPKPEIVYKLHMYTPNGQLRYDISHATAYEVGRLWGDLVRSMSSTGWMTLQEIFDAVQDRERRSYRKAATRTFEEIEEGVSYLVECQVAMVRTLDMSV
jgi:hypothetical protein